MKKLVLIIRSIFSKIRETSGESIAETLVSLLIVVLAFMMLSGAIVASARVNAATEDQTLYLNQADLSPGSNGDITGVVTITKDAGTVINTDKTVKVKYYKMKGTSGILYYYE